MTKPVHWKLDKFVSLALQMYPSLNTYGLTQIVDYFTHFANICFEAGQTEAPKPSIPIVDYSHIPELSHLLVLKIKVLN